MTAHTTLERPTSTPILSAGAPLAMSSHEIAKLTGKQHKHVLRDIDAMLKQIIGDGPNLVHQAKSMGCVFVTDARGYTSEISLPKNLTINLITGYRADLRLKVIDRWLELEGASAPKAPTNMREALMLALEQQEKLDEQGKELAVVRPKARALDELAGTDGTHNIRWSAAECQMKEKDFITALIAARWIYRDTRTGRLTVYARARDTGYMTVKNVVVKHNSGEREGVGQPMLTQKGLAEIMKKLAKEAKARPFAKKREAAA